MNVALIDIPVYTVLNMRFESDAAIILSCHAFTVGM